MKILVLYYSMTGNIFKLAQAVADGAGEVEGAEILIRTVPELMPEENWNEATRTAKEAQKDIPVCTMEELADCDGLIVGTPTRFGNMTSQMKNFIDQTGKLWQEGRMIGKPFGIFTGSATQHGGQETTIISSLIPFIHHGMIYVGVPYSVQELFGTEEVNGGSPYGASVVVGPTGDLGLKANDIAIAKALGKRIAEVAGKLKL